MKNTGTILLERQTPEKNFIEYKKMQENRFRSLKAISWKRLGHDPKEIDLPTNTKASLQIKTAQSPLNGISIREIADCIEEDLSLAKYLEVEESFGVGEKLVAMAEAYFNTGVVIQSQKNAVVKEPITIKISPSPESSTVIDQNLIIAERGSSLSVVFDYTSGKTKNAYHNGITKIYAKENAVVNVVKIQRMDEDAESYDSVIAFVEGNAKVNIISVELGAKVSATSYILNLRGNAGETELNSLYLIDKDRKTDIGYTLNHFGQRTNSKLEAHGVLKDEAKKVFRGTINLKRGASNAKGAEVEYVTMLSEKVKSDSIPALFCDEDNVEGQHAASVGRLDEDKLFYLQSRGFSEKEAKKLVVEASLRPTIDKLPTQELQDLILSEIDRRM